jgi:hypothetical protein
MNQKLNNPIICLMVLYSSHNIFIGIDFLLYLTISLANVLTRVKGLEAKLSANTKALKEAETRHIEEMATAKLAATQAVKEEEERAVKAEKALAEVTQRQTKHEEAAVKRLNALSTSFGSKIFLIFSDCPFSTYMCFDCNVSCCSRTNWGVL